MLRRVIIELLELLHERIDLTRRRRGQLLDVRKHRAGIVEGEDARVASG